MGYQYITARKTYEESKSKQGEGIETIKNEPYTEDEQSGMYTYKILHFKSRLPTAIRWALPDKYCHLHEKSWNSFPHCHTVYSNPGLKERLQMTLESWHTEYKANEPIPDNVFNLTKDELKIRKVVYLDILDGKPASKERDLENWQCPELNVTKPFGQYRPKSHHKKKDEDEKKATKSPPEWTKNFQGDMMVAIKVVKIDCQWTGFQSIIEKYVTHSLLHNLFLNNHRDLMLWANEWSKMTMKEVMEYQKNMYQKINAQGFDKDEDKPDELVKEASPESHEIQGNQALQDNES